MPYKINLSYGTFAELILACVLILLAARNQAAGQYIYWHALIAARRFTKRPSLMILAAIVLPILLRLALLPLVPVPLPYVMEEFNHLFLTQTYDLGRVSNPVHPLAVMVQTYQQIEWPHYVSARPPLPPIFFYLGQALLGSPFLGNLIAVGLTSGALCWALLGWVEARFAAIATFMGIMTFCLFGYWVNSYWAPAPIVLGGALLFGVVPRIERDPRFIWALVCIVALALLAGTRPYENGVFAAVIFGWLAVRFLQKERRARLGRAIVRVALPIAVGLAGIMAAQLFYNEATTGNFAIMPYQIWRASQDVTPVFLWQPIALDRVFYNIGANRFASWNLSVVKLVTDNGFEGAMFLFSRHGVTFRDLLGPFLFLAFLCWSPGWISRPATASKRREFSGLVCVVFIFLAVCGPYFGSLIKAIVIFTLYKRWQNQRERLAILIIAIGMLATSLPTFYMNVYFAAYTAPIMLLVATGLRNLSRWNRPWGKSLIGYLIIGAVLVPTGSTIAYAVRQAGVPIQFRGPPLSHFDIELPNPHHEVREFLEKRPGRHVVFVELGERVDAIGDPTWNSPEIDQQQVVWLRHLRPAWTATAAAYYEGRNLWLMKVKPRGEYELEPFEVPSEVQPVPLESLPNPDRAPAEALGARRLND